MVVKGEASDISEQSRRVSLSTVTRLTETGLDVGCLSLQTRPITVQPKLYCLAQGSSSLPEIMFIGWKAAETFQPMSSPMSTSGRRGILSAMWDRCFHFLATLGVAMSLCDAGMYSLE